MYLMLSHVLRMFMYFWILLANLGTQFNCKFCSCELCISYIIAIIFFCLLVVLYLVEFAEGQKTILIIIIVIKIAYICLQCFER